MYHLTRKTQKNQERKFLKRVLKSIVGPLKEPYRSPSCDQIDDISCSGRDIVVGVAGGGRRPDKTEFSQHGITPFLQLCRINNRFDTPFDCFRIVKTIRI